MHVIFTKLVYYSLTNSFSIYWIDNDWLLYAVCDFKQAEQGLRASSLQFTSPLEFNAIFRDGFTLRHELAAGSKIRDPVPAKFKHVTNIVICPLLCCDYVTYVPALKFPKNWLRTLGYQPKIHHFFFSHKWDTRFKYLPKLCPYILMYSALHIMQWFSQVVDVFTPKIKRKIFDFYILWIKTNIAYTRLEMIARTKYCTTLTTTTASNWFVTLYYKLLPAVRSSSKHGRRWSSLLLYSIWPCVLTSPNFCHTPIFEICDTFFPSNDHIFQTLPPTTIKVDIFWKEIEQGIQKNTQKHCQV